jgi:3-oxoacyl-[acyl-carrier protein] reductase
LLARGVAGIGVNALAPGAVPGGGFNAGAFEFTGSAARAPRPATGHGQHGAGLLSERFAGCVTGTTVVVDGGIGLYNWIPLPTE